MVTWIQIRWPFFSRVVTSPPSLLYFRGKFIDESMRRQRVTKSEVQMTVRKKKFGSLDEVETVVLESSGDSLSSGLP
ncbi:YetF domain-containing protein [Saliphagus sp. GCM10025334]